MTILGKYQLVKKIGQGSFGFIYKAKHIVTEEEVAIKIEAADCKLPTLCRESKILNYLKDVEGVPKLRYYGTQENKNFMVIDLLGHTLTNVIKMFNTEEDNYENYSYDSSSGTNSNCSTNICSNVSSLCNIKINCLNSEYNITKEECKQIQEIIGLSLKSRKIINSTLQMIRLIHSIHKIGFVHRDIKPDNFLFGHCDTSSLYIIDFGLATNYLTKERTHIINTGGKSMIGTARYASLYVHSGNVYSRRDDIISILYVSIYLMKGKLPWQGLKSNDNLTYHEIIENKKKEITIQELCKGLPTEYEILLDYAYKLKFDEKPDYNYIKKMLYSMLD